MENIIDKIEWIVGIAVVIVVMVAVFDKDNIVERPHLWKIKR